MINSIPDNDDRPHVCDSTCSCNPRVEIEDGELIIFHNSFDGREIMEQLGFKNPNKKWKVIEE